MIVGHVQRWIALIVCVVLLAATGSIHARAQRGDQLAALIEEVIQRYRQGKFADATPLAERYVALAAKKYSQNHPEYALAIGWLANVYSAQGRYSEAESLYRLSIVISEKA